MCGIAGFIHKSNKPIDKNQLINMGITLNHRGPDNFSFVIRENAGFAHTRLSIIDTSDAGNQPFCNERYVLCYNGEIYNYLDLKKELIKDGVLFKSTSDTEVLFHYLINKGVEKTLKSIRGMFAFSFYDVFKKTLYLCRDRVGIKPLNWILTNEGLYWASEVKALSQIIPIDLDPIRMIFSFAETGETSGEKTLFKGVKQVRSGAYLQYESGKTPEIHEYFDLPELIDIDYYNEINNYSFESLTNHFKELFENSVKKMLMSDVPMGAFVSGGIDSSLISIFAKKHDENIKLFTADVMGKFSEYQEAKLLSDSLNAHLYDYKFKSHMIVRDWVKTTYYYESPIIAFRNAIPFSNVAQLAREKGVKPVLTGEGSDELFLGYTHPLYENYFKYLKYPVDMLKKMYNIIPGLKNKLFPEPTKETPNLIFNMSQCGENRDYKNKVRDLFSFLPNKDIKYQLLTFELMKHPLIGLLHRNDRMGMMASIESRFPFLDEDILKFGINLHWKRKLHKTLNFFDIRHPFVVDKYIVRNVAKNILPEKLVNKKKEYFKTDMYGDVIIKNGYFKGGYIQDLFELTRKDEDILLQRENKEFLGKLIAVDIFGRSFGMKQKQEEIINHVNNFLSSDSKE